MPNTSYAKYIHAKYIVHLPNTSYNTCQIHRTFGMYEIMIRANTDQILNCNTCKYRLNTYAEADDPDLEAF